MLLVVDVGNTNTVFGLFELDAPDIVATARMSTRRDRMPDEWYAILAPVLESAGVQPGQVTAHQVPLVEEEPVGVLQDVEPEHGPVRKRAGGARGGDYVGQDGLPFRRSRPGAERVGLEVPRQAHPGGEDQVAVGATRVEPGQTAVGEE